MLFEKIVSTPSLALQRIILAIFLTAAIATAWWQHSGTNGSYLVQQFVPTPLPPGVADLDFGAAEAAWSELEVDAEGGLSINAQTELALSEVIALMNPESSDLQMARMTFLIEKQFGADASEQFAGLLPVLKNYKEVEQRWWEENGSQMPPAYSELFQLQDEVLGEELAGKLFAEQRRLANIMLSSYRIQNDPGLTQEQKDQALADLQSGFEVGAPNE